MALSRRFKCLEGTFLTDYKVRVIESHNTTAAKVRVLIRTTDGQESWGTVGVSDNILDASWQALVDAFNYKLFRTYGGNYQAAYEEPGGGYARVSEEGDAHAF